jgi:hypothetical protein
VLPLSIVWHHYNSNDGGGMKGRQRIGWLLMGVLAMAAQNSHAADAKKGGLVGNSYASQMEQISDSLLRITARKKVAGAVSEINTPGTSTYQALQAVQIGAVVRAAIEARNQGYKVFQVVSKNADQSRIIEKRSASHDFFGDGVTEKNSVFAYGHYTDDVELVLEMTVKLLPGDMPVNPTPDFFDVDAVLIEAGLADVVTVAQ